MLLEMSSKSPYAYRPIARIFIPMLTFMKLHFRVMPRFANPSSIYPFTSDLENIKSKGSWLEKTQVSILSRMTIDTNSKNCSPFVKEHEVEWYNTSSWIQGKEDQATSEKLWQLSAPRDLSSSPLPAPKSAVIQWSALGFGVGRC